DAFLPEEPELHGSDGDEVRRRDRVRNGDPHRLLLGSWERERADEIGEVLELIESIDELLHARDGCGAERHTRQLAKLRPNFVFSIRILEVAACAFSEPRDLTPIGERDGHPCWLESRHAGVE